MSDSLIGALAALAGVVIGGILEAYRSRRIYRRERRAAYFDREVQLIQELFEVVTIHRHAYGLAIVSAMAAARGLPDDSLSQEKIPWERLKMLVTLHAPDLKYLVAKFDKHVGRTGGLIVQARARGASLDTVKKQLLVDKLAEVQIFHDSIYNELEQRLVERAENVRKEMRLDAGFDQ